MGIIVVSAPPVSYYMRGCGEVAVYRVGSHNVLAHGSPNTVAAERGRNDEDAMYRPVCYGAVLVEHSASSN